MSGRDVTDETTPPRDRPRGGPRVIYRWVVWGSDVAIRWPLHVATASHSPGFCLRIQHTTLSIPKLHKSKTFKIINVSSHAIAKCLTSFTKIETTTHFSPLCLAIIEIARYYTTTSASLTVCILLFSVRYNTNGTVSVIATSTVNSIPLPGPNGCLLFPACHIHIHFEGPTNTPNFVDSNARQTF